MSRLQSVSRKSVLGLAGSFGLLAALGNAPAVPASREGIVGAWNLVSFDMDEGTGREKPPSPSPAALARVALAGDVAEGVVVDRVQHASRQPRHHSHRAQPVAQQPSPPPLSSLTLQFFVLASLPTYLTFLYLSSLISVLLQLAFAFLSLSLLLLLPSLVLSLSVSFSLAFFFVAFLL